MKLKSFATLSRVLVGIVFIFSGFVKGVDPEGSTIKFSEYFTSFGVAFLAPLSQFFAVLLSTVEMAVGVMLVCGLMKRMTAWISALFMMFFTIVTVVIYFGTPIEDCGCFGDAIKLSNGETLLKNIVLIALLTPFFISYYRYNEFYRKSNIKGVVLAFLFSLFFPLYAMINLPLVDFLPYKIGVNIREKMRLPKGAKEDIYETILSYKNIETEEIVDFTLEDTTWHDQSKWEFVESKVALIEKGDQPEISSFNITTQDGIEISSSILDDKSRVVAIVLASKEIPKKVARNIDKLYDLYSSKGYDVIVLTQHITNDIAVELSKNVTSPISEIYNMDETLLKSFIRAPYGVVILDGGVIAHKANLLRGI